MKFTRITKKLVKKLIAKRKSNSHKYNYGHVLILAGSRGLTGAAVLCANACIRSGAGLVTLGVPKSQQGIVAKKILPEIMTLPLKETMQRTISVNAFSEIKNFIHKRKVDVIAIGPGLSTNNSTKKLVKKLVKVIRFIPIILDADGLNAINESDLKISSHNIIATPHPGELSRITGISTKEIQRRRLEITKKFAKINNIICILKGYQTVINNGDEVFVNTTGNPGMATAGCGDVLTGMISAFIEQVNPTHHPERHRKNLKEKLLNASIVSVYLHGLAGDIAAKEKTEISLIATDIIEKIPEALKSVLDKS
ncbi:MAG: NAD(P)H-hydrate dehydratase [Elusimicrobiota bacterium]|nr:NAD(P)H-hydrate dehydratase [Elusimicrobiota bacterium]